MLRAKGGELVNWGGKPPHRNYKERFHGKKGPPGKVYEKASRSAGRKDIDREAYLESHGGVTRGG